MANDDFPLPTSNRLIRVVIAFLGSDVIDLIGVLWRLARRVLALKAHEGMYEVLEYEARLELFDSRGEKAILRKREKVRYLQDNIIAYQDKAWGDGQIFADYQCSPGVEVDRYREGHRFQILISLRETKHRNDVDEFHIERTVKNGFTKTTEDFHIEIDHITRKLTLSVVFPHKRFPKQVSLIEQNATRTTPLTAQDRIMLPDGREQFSWTTNKPKLFEAYILRWEW
jgi:hypothetical protein